MSKVFSFLAILFVLTPGPAQGAATFMGLANFAATAADASLSSVGTVAVTANPTNVVADGSAPISLSITVQDDNGAPMAHQTVTITVSGISNRLGLTTGTTDSAGQLTTSLKSSQAGIKTVTAVAGNSAGWASVQFLPGPPEIAKSSFIIVPASSQVADGSAGFLVTATLRDRYSNPVPNYAVAPTCSDSAAIMSPASGNTRSDGSFTTFLTSPKAGRFTVTLPVGAAKLLTTATFYGGEPNLTLSDFAISPNTVMQADGNDAFTAKVTLRDDNNNPVANYPVSLSSSGVAVTFAPPQGTTDGAGQFLAKVKSKYVGPAQISWTAGALTGQSTINFVVGQPKGPTSSITSVPATVVADGSATAVVTGVVRDASGNPVPNQNMTFTVLGTANTVSDTTCTTDADGSCSLTISSTHAEVKKVYLRATNFEAQGTVKFVAGAADPLSSALTANTNATLVADGSAAFVLSAKLMDTLGNPVSSTAVAMSSSASGDIFKPTSGVTDNNGAFTSRLSTKAVGPRSVTATGAGLALGADVAFGVGPMSLSTSTIVGTPSKNIVADGNTVSTLTAVLRDAQGRPLSSLPVVLTSTGTNNQFSDDHPVTDANGLVTVTLASTRAETKKVSLKAGTISMTTALTFVAGAPQQASTVITASPAHPVAALYGGAQLKVTVADAFGNFCPNLPITLSASGQNNTFAVNGGNTNAVGSYTTTLSSTRAEPKVVTATVAGFSVTQNVTFAAALPNVVQTSFTASPGSGVAADGTSTVTLQATVLDAFSNPVAGQSVAFSSTDRHVTFAQKTGLADASGVVSTTLTATTGGSKAIYMQAGKVSKAVTVTFAPVVALQIDSAIAPSQPWYEQAGQVGGYDVAAAARAMMRPMDSVTIEALLRDAYAASAQPRSPVCAAPLILHVDQDNSNQWVVASSSDPSLDIYVQDAHTLSWHQETVSLDEMAQDLAAGDFNGDGILDLVVSGSHFITAFMSAADCQPFFSQNIATEGAVSTLAVKDFNEDGLDDIAILTSDDDDDGGSDSLQVLYSLGNGSFAHSPVMLCNRPESNEGRIMETKSKRLASCLRAKLLP